ncbi:putative lipoprotein [Teredinibacter turnerae T7901]|uniref:Lipoprotein n=1 Tax=Teredinibacter turnerae (strain ATCC 39867 / T7901) TaxID=377629 RepID=C5BU99_TERTT|nr:hypothetical protein [Teredinibacter turnerae]ACR13000.1 putative lipoprotein [Teredinibacter turnerae T7901]
MKRYIVLFIIFVVSACSEGIQIKDEDIVPWFESNKEKLEQLVSVFQENRCIERVELSSMEFIKQACDSESEKSDIEKIKSILRSLNVVLATSYRSADGDFNVSILLYRDRPDSENKSSSVSVEYWSSLPARWKENIGCELFVSLPYKSWYVSYYPGIVGCN